MPEPEFHHTLQFPYHPAPRTWLIISGLSATGLRLARALLSHGDNVVLGTPPATFDEVSTSNPSTLTTPFRRRESELLRQFLLSDIITKAPVASDEAPDSDTGDDDEPDTDSWHKRFRPVRLDPRATAQCQMAVAQTVKFFGALDVLVCNSSEVLIGTVEELAGSEETRAMLREQFEVNLFANVNAIKAAVPAMRRKGGGHMVVVTGITSHLGTPGLGAFCASGWALEGYCDSIAYEVAPFNIKLTIIQPHLETAVLPNRIKAAPLMDQYAPSSHPAPLARNSIGSLLDRVLDLTPSQPATPKAANKPSSRRDSTSTNETEARDSRPIPVSLGSKTDVVIQEPTLPSEMQDSLIEETLFSICAIGGHPNPPQRHIVGTEAVVSVKEKLKTVSVELEDLVGTSTAVDLIEGDQE